ncbi:MAG TPA: class D sortase [Chloroflexia bacterium]|nr:class D sortase [Chloroflexia bacterium]
MVFGRLTARAATRNHATSRGWAGRRRGAGGAITGPLPPEPDDEQPPEAELDRFSAPVLSQVVERKGPAGTAVEAVRLAVERRRNRPRPQKTRSAILFDRMLLALEIAGALVVAWLAFQYIYTVYFDKGTPRRLSAPAIAATQTARANAAAAPTATPTLFAEVAPPETGGPEDAEGATGDGPAAGEGSEAGPTVEPTQTPVPTPTFEPELLLPNRLRIPVMFLDSPVHEVEVNMGEWDVSPLDVGHHVGTGNPGEAGNVVLAAHRDINSALFRELDRLEPGDEVFVYNALREYRYVVQESFVVNPGDVDVMEPTGDKRVTLITCTPIGLATQRLIVVAALDETYAAGP